MLINILIDKIDIKITSMINIHFNQQYNLMKFDLKLKELLN